MKSVVLFLGLLAAPTAFAANDLLPIDVKSIDQVITQNTRIGAPTRTVMTIGLESCRTFSASDFQLNFATRGQQPVLTISARPMADCMGPTHKYDLKLVTHRLGARIPVIIANPRPVTVKVVQPLAIDPGRMTCMAYFEGFAFDSDNKTCEAISGSGCSFPFDYHSEQECKNMNGIK